MKVEKGWLGRLAVVLIIMALALWLMYSILPSVVLNALYAAYIMLNAIPWILHGDEKQESTDHIANVSNMVSEQKGE